jgi:heme-degrading monooxygenase HmoA
VSELGFSAAFIFVPGEYDDEFRELDGQIEEFVKTLPGFLRTERWMSFDGRIKNSIYYFADRETIAKLARFEPHRIAKKNYAKWYKGYRIEIAEITQVYGDGNLSLD